MKGIRCKLSNNEIAPSRKRLSLLAVECANANSSAFAERLGFSPYDNRRRWVGSVDSIREALW